MSIMQKAGSVQFRDVVKKYGSVTALKPLNLEIQQGELVTLLGPSGCGKTTTLRLIAGLEAATEGTIYIGGKDVTHLTATYRNVSMVFQSYALFPHMSVVDNVSYGLRVNKVPAKEAKAKAEEGLAMVGLAGYGERLPSELSGGQQQRVAVARAVVLEPEVLLLDEPLSNLDAKLRRHVREEIREIQQKLGLTAVYVTHDQEEAMAVSDRIIVMNKAEIAQSGTPRELYNQPNSAFIADFIGDANVVDCEIAGFSEGTVSLKVGGASVVLPYSGPACQHGKLAIRPEGITVTQDGANGIAASIAYAAYLGNQIQYSLNTGFGKLFAIDHNLSATVIPTGAEAFIHLKEEGLAFLPEA
ncbi:MULTISPECIES: ABC transporter ATP-binding protein [unclassified Pseudovibrio]|uniref:ABC transporter ATP-binding protein n=1 Tax=unclassified Pseudovibrio TaxID=2627060 RepID=UPI0007AE838D|nr:MULTISPECIES: ABC transporter ATP-binding protein [unclassified Pseudovibrio]KZK98657.1 Spermidine/putrescine import ATP-binding protein PotA [Pseudovibrio sp. W74]KZL09150.1 Spermidine/putrescine import ATP-binding protein PotA [Pseudovibrio sp. Ad14]